MKKIKRFILSYLFASIIIGLTPIHCFANNSSLWNLYLERPNEQPLLVNSFSFEGSKTISFTKQVAGFTVNFIAKNNGDYWYYVAEAKAKTGNKKCYLSLSRTYSNGATPYGFFGLVEKSGIYRQSPHEPADHGFANLLLQAVPMIALQNSEGFEVAVCNTPALFDNYTTQTYDLRHKKLKLSSGDNGFIFKDNVFQLNTDTIDRKAKGLYRIEPYYFSVNSNKAHQMDGIYMNVKGKDLGKLRESVNSTICKHWSNGKITDLLGSTFFSTAYMNLRVNETGQSKYWVVPAIGYANKQYSRDAFWISMVLPRHYSKYCYENEAASDTKFAGAERQLFTLVWAYRNYLNGEEIDTSRIRRILTIVEQHVTNGYYSGFDPNARKIGCWQGQADLLAYEKDDAISNNQGLFVTALMCAEKLGIKPKVSIEQALKNYQNLFNPKIGALSLSLQKDTMLAVDALMGDLLAQVYLGKALLSTEKVLTHYETMKKYAKTNFGFKFFCNADGSYLKKEQYDSKSFKSAIDKVEDGNYQCGGSWYLYDMQLLMDAYLHGAKDAEDLMIWRTKLEFELGNSTHEFINTKTGKPHQPNMGWNAGVYGLWSEIVRQGKATNRFFTEIDKLKEEEK